MSNRIIVKNVRGLYPFLTAPRKNDKGEPGKYSLQCMLKKGDPQIEVLKKEIMAAAKEKFGENVNLKSLSLPLRDGDEQDAEHYHGHVYFNAKSTSAPQIVNRFNEKATDQDLYEYCYSGATYHISCAFYGYNKNGNKGVACGLSNVMLRAKTEPIQSGASAQSDFADLKDDADAEFGKDPYAPQNKQSDEEDFGF